MKTLIEMAMSHLASWIAATAGLVLAWAQLTKARNAQSRIVAKAAKANAPTVAVDSPALSAKSPMSWRKALLREVGLDLFQVLNCVVLLVLTAWQPLVTPPVVVTSCVTTGLLFFSLSSALSKADRLSQNWRN